MRVDGWTYDARVDTLESSSSSLRLGLASVKRVLEVEERLTDGVREGNGRRVDESDLADAPCLRQRFRSAGLAPDKLSTHHQSPGHIAAEGSSAKKKHLGVLDLLEVERRHDAPPHELEVEVDSLISESVRSEMSVCSARRSGRTHFVGSINGAKFANLGPSLPLSFFSHPTTLGRLS